MWGPVPTLTMAMHKALPFPHHFRVRTRASRNTPSLCERSISSVQFQIRTVPIVARRYPRLGEMGRSRITRKRGALNLRRRRFEVSLGPSQQPTTRLEIRESLIDGSDAVPILHSQGHAHVPELNATSYGPPTGGPLGGPRGKDARRGDDRPTWRAPGA